MVKRRFKRILCRTGGSAIFWGLVGPHLIEILKKTLTSPGDASAVRRIKPTFYRFTFFLKIMPSALHLALSCRPAIQELDHNRGPPPGIQCFSNIFCIGDLPVVHGFALAVHRSNQFAECSYSHPSAFLCYEVEVRALTGGSPVQIGGSHV
ncbi:hypothetical protein HAX54_050609, partial [Datura stramonium]|nr:hypothetical protein [Datura stramonium]